MSDFMSASFWNDRYANVDSVWSMAPNEFVVEFLNELPPGRMIDLAGGEGRNALWFAGRGWQAENADISSVAINKFLERAVSEGLYDQVVGTTLEVDQLATFQLAPADLGVIAYLQIPPEQLTRSILDLAAALAPGAIFFGVWHARENLADGFGGPQRADVLPTVEELRAVAETAGFHIHTCELRDRIFELDGVTHRAIDVVLHATVTE
jgi:SAM-dependent methyltransferase